LHRAIDAVLSQPLANAPRPVTFSVLRVPFFLEPQYDESKVFIESNRDRLVQKWGGVQGWERQKQRHDLKGRGQAVGISHFNLDRLAANTMASHRLVQWIGKTFGLDVCEGIYDLLNTYYFVDGHSLNDKPRLAERVALELPRLLQQQREQQQHPLNNMVVIPSPPAVKAPSADEILTFLHGTEGRREIETAFGILQDDLGIHSIPTFIIEGTTVVNGAARSETLVDIFRDIERRGHVQRPAIFAPTLGVSPQIMARGSHYYNSTSSSSCDLLLSSSSSSSKSPRTSSM
jgi:predicted DsbA family dithiol-disulfide isomerase